MISVYIDGGATPNPGKGGIGIVFKGDLEYEISESCGDEEVTNNQAEYRALNRALLELHNRGFDDAKILVHTDSQLLCGQLIGGWAIRRGAYVSEYQVARRMMKSFKHLTLTRLDRSYLKRADALAREGILKNELPTDIQ